MSMTGSGGEETSANSSEKPDREACTVDANDGVQSINESCSSTLNKCLSPILGLFGRREFVPLLLEHERALLVIKEHDYAKTPDRPEVLQLSSIHTTDLGNRNGDIASMAPNKDAKTLLNARTDLLLLRESFNHERNELSVVGHLRQVVGLQVALIREQQEQLHEKDKDLSAVRKEKEQLEARLERMERRLAILQKNSRLKQNDVSNADPPQSPLTPTSPLNTTPLPTRAHLTRRESLVASETSVRSRSASVEPGSRNRSRPTSRATTPLPPEDGKEAGGSTVKRSHKRKVREIDKDEQVRTPRKRTKHQRELRTSFEYTGLQLSVPKQRLSSQSEPSPMQNDNDALDSAVTCVDVAKVVSNDNIPAGDIDQDIVTPSWKLCSVVGSLPESLSDCEDLIDELFYKRHRKPEEDEKRRKRWDIQRARTLREHHELLRKYNMKGGGGEKVPEKRESDTSLSSFIPELREIDTIEVMDTVTVSAFGRPLPVLKSSEFELPWFDLDVREAKETVRKTRSKTKTSRPSVGGSADEL